MSMPIDVSKIRSGKIATVDQVKGVIDRYKAANAAGTTPTGDVALHQQAGCAVKILPSGLNTKDIQGMCEVRGISWDERYGTRVKRYVASDETVDSYGDIIKQSGWDFTRFEKNPAIMWVHDYEQAPVGSGIDYYVKDNALNVFVLFMLPETYPWADTVYKMVEAGFLKGNSVGFAPKKVMYVEDEAERQALGLGKFGVLFVEQLLIEDTICPIGANPAALLQDSMVAATQKGVLSRDELSRLVKDDATTRAPENIKQIVDRALAIISETKTVGGTAPKQEERGCIPFASHSKDAEDAAWNGPEEIAAANAGDLKVMCAWYDESKPDVKASYKLPHHRANGYHTVWKGVAAAMSALLGGRGGVGVPDGDRKGIYAHLRKHYEEFAKTAPGFKTLDSNEPDKTLALISDLKNQIAAMLETHLHKSTEILDRLNDLNVKVIGLESAVAGMSGNDGDTNGTGGTKCPVPGPQSYASELIDMVRDLSLKLPTVNKE